MKLADIIKKIIAKIGSGEKLTDEEKLEMEKALEGEPEKPQSMPPPAEPTFPPKSVEELKSMVDALAKKNNDLLAALQAETAQREQSKLALENEAKTKRAGEIQAIIEKAVKATYLAPADEASKTAWKNMLESNYENASKLLQTHIDAAEKKATTKPTGATGDSTQQSGAKLGTPLGASLRQSTIDYLLNQNK